MGSNTESVPNVKVNKINASVGKTCLIILTVSIAVVSTRDAAKPFLSRSVPYLRNTSSAITITESCIKPTIHYTSFPVTSL